MFRTAFSFSGRIRRTEYGLSYLAYTVVLFLLQVLFPSDQGTGNALISLAAIIPCGWFLLAQGAKRCHDRNNSGWYQLIPFYALWMLFAAGDSGPNAYGDDPKAPAVSVDTY